MRRVENALGYCLPVALCQVLPLFLSLCLGFVCPFSFVHADEPCHSKYWTIKGTMSPRVRSYDELLASLAKSHDPVRAINEQIRKEGLLLQLSAPQENLHGLSDYLTAEGASGFSVGLFFNRMRVWEGIKAFFATVYEVAAPESTHAIRKWLVPMGAWPAAIEGFRLIYVEKLVGVCREFSYNVSLRVTDEGNFEAISRDTFPEPKAVPEAQCTAQRAFFRNSKYSMCKRFRDLASQAVRTLVWDFPVN